MPRQAAKPQKPAADPPLGRKDWIDAAIVMLAEDNVEALRVDTLAEKLGVTKGSFYWHFKGREDLLFAVLDEWRLRMTSEVAVADLRPTGTPWERLERLLRIAISGRPDVPGGPFEMTLRDWARRDPKVAAVVRDVDADRIAFAAQLYREAGLSESDAEDYAEAAHGVRDRHPDDAGGQRKPRGDQATPADRRGAAVAARPGRGKARKPRANAGFPKWRAGRNYRKHLIKDTSGSFFLPRPDRATWIRASRNRSDHQSDRCNSA